MRRDDKARLREVLEAFARHGLGGLASVADLGELLGLGGQGRSGPRRRAEALRCAFEELGGAFPTIARVASGRSDVLPLATTQALAGVDDRGTPVDFAELKPAMEQALRRSMEATFEHFDAEPSAWTSLSQTHRARLRPELARGPVHDVAIKVLKPGASQRIERDLDLLQRALAWVGRSHPEWLRDLGRVISEIDANVREELDLAREAHEKRELGRLLGGFGRLRVPRVVGELSTGWVLVTESPERHAPSEAKPQNVREAAEQLWRGGLQQILVDGCFVCDLRWEDLSIDEKGRLVIGGRSRLATVAQETRLALTALLLALAEGDGDRAAAACVEMGVAGPWFKDAAFRVEVRSHVGGVTGKSIGEVARELARAAHEHGIRFPQEVMAVGNALAAMESVCRKLDPRLDPIASARQTATSVLSQQMSQELSSARLLSSALELRSLITQGPSSLRRVLSRASSNELRFGIEIDKVEQFVAAIGKLGNRLTLGLITAALIVGSALLIHVDAGWKLWGYPLAALGVFLLAVGLGLYVVLRILREDSF